MNRLRENSVFIIKLMLAAGFAVITGCSSVTEKPVEETVVVPEQVVIEPVKETAVSPEVLYLLMTAEIAGQRNQFGVALDGYLRAAKKVDDVRVAERAAKIGLFLKDSEKTSEAVSLWLQQDSSNLTARKIAALSSLKQMDRSQAVAHLDKILNDDPAGFEATLLELTRLLGKEGKADFVYDVLEELSVMHPDQAGVYFVQALLAGQLNRQSVVRQKVDKALSLQPSWDKALVLRAQLLAQQQQYQAAKDDLLKVVELSPENNKIKKVLGQVLMKMESFDEAIELYRGVLKSMPEDGESQFALALIYLQQEDEKQATKYLKGLVNKPRWDAQASFYLGRVAYKNKQYDAALVWFDKVTRGGYVYDASIAAISVLLDQKQYEQAEQRIKGVKNRFPKRKVNILLFEAEILTEQKKSQQAFDLLTEALKDFPDNRDLLYSRALVAEKIDRLDVLEADLKRVLSKSPNDAAVLNALGYTLVDRTERYQEAAEYLEQALLLKPEEAVILDSVGWLMYKQGKLDEALPLLRKAYEKQAENEIAAHLIEVLWFIGEKDNARELFNLTIEKSPKDEFLLKIQQKLPELTADD